MVYLLPDYAHLSDVELSFYRIVYRMVASVVPRYFQTHRYGPPLARRPMRCPRDVQGEEAEAYVY